MPTWGTITHLELQAGLSHGPERRGLPVRLFGLFPHDHIKTGAVLVGEDKAGVIVIGHGVDVESAFKVHPVERRVSCPTESRVRLRRSGRKGGKHSGGVRNQREELE